MTPLAPRDLALRCRCGKVQGRVLAIAPGAVTRVVCHCAGCQAYAHALGHPEEQLDDQGGSDLIQFAPASLRIDQGLEHVACIQQTVGGGLRWHTSCCQTALVNTLPTMGMPFAAVAHRCLVLDGEAPDARFGPVLAQVNHRMSRAEARAKRGTFWALLTMLVRYLRLIAGWWLRGQTRPFPFFTAEGAPLVQARRLTVEERASVPPALRARIKLATEAT